jgi:hypothetical protein
MDRKPQADKPNIKSNQEHMRSTLEEIFDLQRAVNLCAIDNSFDVRSFVTSIRNAEVVIAFHRNRPDWWLLKGKAFLAELIRGDSAALHKMMAIIVANRDTVDLLTSAVRMMANGQWPPGRGVSVFFATQLVEFSHQGELH